MAVGIRPTSHGVSKLAHPGGDRPPQQGACISGEAPTSQRARLERRKGVAIPSLESHSTTPGGGPQATTHPGRQIAGSPSHGSAVPQSSDHQHPTHVRDHDQSGNVQDGHLPSQPQCTDYVGHDANIAGQYGLSAGGDGVQNRTPGSRPGRAEDSSSSVRSQLIEGAFGTQVTSLVLVNQSTVCYMDSVMQALLWMMGRSQFDTSSLVGTGAQFFRSMLARTSTRPINLLQESQWCSMLNGWGEVHRQHDVCEFLAFILQQNDFGLFYGRRDRLPWQGISDASISHSLILLFCICQIEDIRKKAFSGSRCFLMIGIAVLSRSGGRSPGDRFATTPFRQTWWQSPEMWD